MFSRINDINRMFGTMDLLRDRLFGEPDGPFSYHRGQVPSLPKTNLVENSDHFEIQAEVPGLSKEDLEIKLQGNYLEISGTRSIDSPEGYRVHRQERSANSFSRSFTLPDDVDDERVEAVLKDGILYLTLAKSETAKPKQITIN
ncbi:MAG TPA: heat-shock protein Hsp20 [Desulfobacteraceae bacterium]|nr:heat-shock protein Hsp20 [Desulfobacteraceae bacterium]